jgi:cation diffusion facilitator family transporter
MGLLSDALEGLVNVVAAVVAYIVLAVAEQPPDDEHAYGHHKAEYFSSAIEGLLIVVAAFGIVWAAGGRLLQPYPLHGLGPGIVVAAVAGFLNFATARVMYRVAAREDSITLEADASHLMADVWTSVGVITGLAIVFFVPRLAILDPLIALIVAGHIGWVGIGLVSRSVDGLMDRSLPADEITAVRGLLDAALPPGASYAELRTRKSGRQRFIDLKLIVPGDETVAAAHQLCDRIETLLDQRFGGTSVNIHVEPAGRDAAET